MTTYVMREIDGKLQTVEKHLVPPRGRQFVSGVISDTIPDMVHPANGKQYDSKSAFRRVTKAYGYTEVGNEKQSDNRRLDHQDFAKDVGEAIRKVNQGYRPATEPGRFTGKGGWQ